MMAPQKVHTSIVRSLARAAFTASVNPLNFDGDFEKEESLLREACLKQGLSCARNHRQFMDVGDATVDLMQLQKALDHQPPKKSESVVSAWVEKARKSKETSTVSRHISNVFPHIRPPPDRDSLPWSATIAHDRLLCCLVRDERNSIRYLDPIEIANHGLGATGLLERAKTNLSLLPPYSLSDCIPHPEFSDVWRIETHDGHDAARLLTANTLTGQPLIAWVPHRDRLVLTTRSIDELGALSAKLRGDAIQSASAATHPISAEAFFLNQGQISHLRFQGDHANGRLLLPRR